MAKFPQVSRRAVTALSGLVAVSLIALAVVAVTTDSDSDRQDDLALVGGPDTTTTVVAPPTVTTTTLAAADRSVDDADSDADSAPPPYLDGSPDHLQPSSTDDSTLVGVDGAAPIDYPTTTTSRAPSAAPLPTAPPSSTGGAGAGAGGGSPATTVTNPPPPPSGSTVALGLSASNTGVVGGQNSGVCSSTLRELSGAITINDSWLDSQNGGSRTLENFNVSGNVVVAADNVTLRCGRVSGNANYTIENRSNGLKLEWIEAYQGSDGKTILGGNYTAYRCNVHGGEDSIHVNTGAVTITECYVHDQNYIGGDPHPDAIQATSGGSVHRLTVVRSKLISFYKAPNAALQINVANSWSITDSYLWGGVYSILGDPGNPGTVANNYFGWDSSQSGAIGGVSTTRSGNVWWEWLSPKCSGSHSAPTCATPGNHPGNGTPI